IMPNTHRCPKNTVRHPIVYMGIALGNMGGQVPLELSLLVDMAMQDKLCVQIFKNIYFKNLSLGPYPGHAVQGSAFFQIITMIGTWGIEPKSGIEASGLTGTAPFYPDFKV